MSVIKDSQGSITSTESLQEAICSSLEDYNKQIEQLKQEMNDATHGADSIRNDISALAQRYAVIERDEECGVLIALLCQKKDNLGMICQHSTFLNILIT